MSRFLQHYNRYHAKIKRALENKVTLYLVKLFVFIILYKAGEYAFKYLEKADLTAGFFSRAYYDFSYVITGASVRLNSLFFRDIHANPGFIIVIHNIPTIQMLEGCTGLMQFFQVIFILAFFPMTFKHKLIFLPVSMLIILFASLFHYIILILVAHSFHDSFTIFHNIISRVIFYIFFFINFVLWNKYPGT